MRSAPSRGAARTTAGVLTLLGLALPLAGCGSGPTGSDAACRDVRASVDALAAEITALGADIESGTAVDDGTLKQREQEWAALVLGDRECFSAERVAVALTLAEPAAG